MAEEFNTGETLEAHRKIASEERVVEFQTREGHSFDEDWTGSGQCQALIPLSKWKLRLNGNHDFFIHVIYSLKYRDGHHDKPF